MFSGGEEHGIWFVHVERAVYFPLARRVRRGFSVLPLPRVDQSCPSSFARRGWKGKGSSSEVEEKTTLLSRGERERNREGGRNISFSSLLPRFLPCGPRGSLTAALSTAPSARSFACRVFTEGSRFGCGTRSHAGYPAFGSRPPRDRETTSTTAAPIFFLLPFHRSTLRFFRPRVMLRPSASMASLF